MQLYIGIIGVAVGALISGATAIVQEALRGRRETTGRAAAALEAKNQRDHEQFERRYEDRKETYLAFERAVLIPERQALTNEQRGETSPADMGDDMWHLQDVENALVQIDLLGSENARVAAHSVASTVHKYSYEFGDKQYSDLGRVSEGLMRSLSKVAGWTAKPCSTTFSGT